MCLTLALTYMHQHGEMHFNFDVTLAHTSSTSEWCAARTKAARPRHINIQKASALTWVIEGTTKKNLDQQSATAILCRRKQEDLQQRSSATANLEHARRSRSQRQFSANSSRCALLIYTHTFSIHVLPIRKHTHTLRKSNPQGGLRAQCSQIYDVTAFPSIIGSAILRFPIMFWLIGRKCARCVC